MPSDYDPATESLPLKFHGSVWTTLDVVGFHNWPEAPTEVSHLRARHRHLFKIRVAVSVDHPERAVEFQLLRANLSGFIEQNFDLLQLGVEFGTRSCESIAQALIGFLIDFYPGGWPYEVTVSEDGESGATLRAEM